MLLVRRPRLVDGDRRVLHRDRARALPLRDQHVGLGVERAARRHARGDVVALRRQGIH
tara:strand:- start:488 stop:661 length:174 start_codon:yes stop_codon:yes gene_type:complete